ncbi:protein disulfide-isomerase A6 [Strigomonas culicis]|uniref:Protein disulfide-isomerase A6 n=1 Tax=Strigomonas culicis TaxID=28005 RepID=S9UGE7_9TRYP|nr:protein disulfide-isomerase A6 [Strigomonas culicis]|eukprot:EPY27824.1 protein disulfide-isomerase A6 [Strigomonas culicis]
MARLTLCSKTVLLLVCLLYCCTTVLAFPFGRGSGVAELSPATFSQFIDTHKPVVILFYAPWCGHCKNFHADYEKFAHAVKGSVRVGALNADTHSALGQQYGVKGFPTIKYWKVGKKGEPQEYAYQRTAAALQSFVTNDVSSSHVITSASTVEALKSVLIKATNKTMAVLLSAKAKVPPIYSIMAMSPKLRDAMPFVFVGSPSADVQAALGIGELPKVAFVKLSADGSSMEATPFAGVIAYEPMAKFFLACSTGDCDAEKVEMTAAAPEVTTATPAADAAAGSEAAPRAAAAKKMLPIGLVPYAANGLMDYCSYAALKLHGQTPLCVIRLGSAADLGRAHASFSTEPLLFLDASAAESRQVLLADLVAAHIFTADEAAARLSGVTNGGAAAAHLEGERGPHEGPRDRRG